MGLGVLAAPRKMRAAFVRGRHTRNLYDRAFDDALLGCHVGELRAELGLDEPAATPTRDDLRAYRRYAATSVAVLLAHILVLLLPFVALWWVLA